MVGETSTNPQFSDEAMTLAIKSNFLFDEMKRAELALGQAVEHRDEAGSGSDYIATDEDYRITKIQFNRSVGIAATVLAHEHGAVERGTGELVVSLGTAFYVSHRALSGRIRGGI